MFLFGSRANGMFRKDSDIDVLVNEAEADWLLEEHPEWLLAHGGPVDAFVLFEWEGCGAQFVYDERAWAIDDEERSIRVTVDDFEHCISPEKLEMLVMAAQNATLKAQVMS